MRGGTSHPSAALRRRRTDPNDGHRRCAPVSETTNAPLTAPVTYDQQAGTYRTRYDWASSVPLSTVIVEVVAEVAGIDPRDVGRLHQAVDPESLDGLFQPTPTAGVRRDGQVSFDLDDHRVTVHGTGVIEVEAPGRG